jgi:outer membrane protein
MSARAHGFARTGASRLALAALMTLAGGAAQTETLAGALTRAYHGNPSLNSGRASVRAIDENVPQALSGMRPHVSSNALLGLEDRRNVSNQIDMDNNDPLTRKFTQSVQSGRSTPRQAAVTIEQPLFDGFKTQNQTRSAESGVFAARERLRLLEQRVLFDGVSAYMSVLRDTATLQLQQNNVTVLTEQLRQTRERYLYGQITLTDIAQAEARLAAGRSQIGAARAALDASVGFYQQIIGEEPKRLSPAPPVDKLLPKTREEAERVAQANHPVILAALHDSDTADLDIRVLESDFMPKLSVVGNVYTQSDIDGRGNRAVGAAVLGRLNMPLYEGGLTSSRVRQAKEVSGQKKLDVDASRAELLALVRANWGALQAAKTQVAAAQVQIAAAERALCGVREEAKAGQRTTLEILNSQQELLAARIGLLMAQRDRVVASYAVLAATGRLSADALGLHVSGYDATVHYDQIKDRWGGTATPDGR